MRLRSFSNRFLFRTWYAVGTATAVGLLATYAIFQWENSRERDRLRADLRQRANAEYPLIRESLVGYIDGVESLRNLFALQRFTSIGKFRALAQALIDKHPAYSELRWIPAVKDTERALFEKQGVQVLAPDFRIQPPPTPGKTEKPDVYPLFYVEPAINSKLLGQDLRETDLGKTLNEARNTRRTVITPLQDASSPRNRVVSVVTPVFGLSTEDGPAVKRGDFLGFVVAAVRVQRALDETRNTHADRATDVMLVDTTPGTPASSRVLYFHSATGELDSGGEAGFRSDWYREMPLIIGGRVWLVLERGNGLWLALHEDESVHFGWLGMLAFTGLTALYLHKLVRRSETSEARAARHAAEIEAMRDDVGDDARRREAAEMLLRSSQQQLHALMENSPSAIFMKDVEGRYLTVNRRFAEMHGRTRDHFVGRSDLDLFPPEVASRLRLSDARVLSSGKAIELEDSLMLPNGNHTSIVHKFPLMDESGNVHGLCGIATDISERKRAEAEVRESRRQLESLLGQLPGMAFRFINDGHLSPIYVSRGALGLTGHSARDFVEGVVKFEEVIHPDDRERAKNSVSSAVKKRRSFEVEYRIIDRSGRVKWVLERGQGVYDEEGKLLFIEGLAIDITQRKDAESEKLLVERRLLEGQKLESIGVLAGGIAHDFNNLLTGIIGNANLAELDSSVSPRVQQNLKQIEIASQRAAELCQQMLAYAGKGRFMVHRVEMGSLVENTVPLLRASISKRAQLQFDLTPGLPPVLADPTQMRQIVMNLVLNASEALGEQDGEIVITTRLVRPTAEDFGGGASLVPPEFGQDFVFFQVRDTGCGMTPETMAKIFDPFFTTKFAGRGLGLAAVQGIIRSHKGGLKVVSSPGKGSTFTLLFPVVSGPVEPGPSRRIVAPAWRREGLALIIDDEDHVRNVTAGLLHSCGFRTELARDGYEGVDIFRIKPNEFDVVMLDMTMPRLSGEETLQLLREVSPDVRVLFMSGYNRREVVDALAGSGVLSFIQKPFTLEALRDQLQAMLA